MRTPRLYTFLILVAFFTLYELASRYQLGDLKMWIFFVPPSRIFTMLFHMLLDGTLPEHFFYSLLRVLVGLLVGILLGAPLGMMIGWFRSMDLAFGPIVDLLRTFPKPALFPLLILLFGIGEVSKVILISIGIFFTDLVWNATAIPARSATKRNFLAI